MSVGGQRLVAERLVEDTGLWGALLLYWQLEKNCKDQVGGGGGRGARGTRPQTWFSHLEGNNPPAKCAMREQKGSCRNSYTSSQAVRAPAKNEFLFQRQI